MDETQSTLNESAPVVILDLDRSGSTWVLHLFSPHDGLSVHRIAHAAHHPKEFPGSLDKLMVADAEFSPGRSRGRRRLRRLLPLRNFTSLGQHLETAAAAGLACELVMRGHPGPQEAPALFVELVGVLQELTASPGEGPVPAVYAVHRLLKALSILSPYPQCVHCQVPTTPPVHFHVSSGEITCGRHRTEGQDSTPWGPDKWAIHVSLLSTPSLEKFRTDTAPLWKHFGDGLGWSFLEDLLGLATRATGPLRSWTFLQQLRPRHRRTVQAPSLPDAKRP